METQHWSSHFLMKKREIIGFTIPAPGQSHPVTKVLDKVSRAGARAALAVQQWRRFRKCFGGTQRDGSGCFAGKSPRREGWKNGGTSKKGLSTPKNRYKLLLVDEFGSSTPTYSKHRARLAKLNVPFSFYVYEEWSFFHEVGHATPQWLRSWLFDVIFNGLV